VTKTKYSGAHQAIRRALLPAAYGTACGRCGRLMLPGQSLDLDHNDDGVGYRGMAHRFCNQRAGGRLGNARQRARRKRRRQMLTKNVVLAVQVAEDRRHTAIAAAGRLGDAVIGAELVSYLDGVAEAPAAVLLLRAEREAYAVIVDPRSPAATLIRPLSDAGVALTEPSTSDVAVGHGTFLDELNAGRLKLAPHPALDAAARHAEQRHLGGGSTWQRRGTAVDESPLDAITLAVWGVLNLAVPFFGASWQ
jgi:hypothetical protein